MENVKFGDESRAIGKPVNWNEELDGPCVTISVHDFTDLQTGMHMMMTAWKPSEAELKALNNGGHVYLCINGAQHPVIKIFAGE